MSTDASQGGKLPGRLFNFANNPVSLFGIGLAFISALLVLIFMIADVGGAFHNAYVPVFAFFILPALFLAGLILIPIGMRRRQSDLLRQGASADELARYPRLDFNDPQIRKAAKIFFLLTAANAVILASASYFAVEHMDTQEFCGVTCHTVMQPEWEAYQHSPHSRVRCVQCHIGPGAQWYVRSKLDGMRQVWKTMWNTFSRPVPSPVETLRPAQETCEACHWPAKHHGDKVRIFSRFAQDEHNSPNYSVLLLKTGGGSLDLGRHGGIHWWHIYSDNRIRYRARDHRREEIDWVELTTAQGEVRVYTREGEDPPEPSEIETQARTMDCIDCHNRPTHFFEEPGRALDRVLEQLPELTELPYYKREVLRAMSEPYERHDDGVTGVRESVVGFYSEAYPGLMKSQKDLVERGADWASSVYGRSFFPEMDTDWETHPNHIGHEDFPGCWRCHDSEMATADGEFVIEQDCELCHAVLIEDVDSKPDLTQLVLE